MLFHFQSGNVTFFPEDQEYFEKRLGDLQKLLGWEAGDEDTVELRVNLEKMTQKSGDKFIAKATLTCPNHGKFHSEVSHEDIKGCADLLKDKLKIQAVKFHDKHK